MANGIPSQNQIVPFSAEALQYKSQQGVPGSLPGTIYCQYSPTAALVSSTTETSLFNNTSTTARGSLLMPAGFLNWNNGYDPAGAAPSITGPGKLIRIKILGTIGNTATPTLTIKATLTNAAGTVTTLSTSGAQTMATITTGAFDLSIDFICAAYSATVGAITCGGIFLHTTAAVGAPQVILLPGTATTSFDTTAAYTIGVTATWGASSASNTLTATAAFIEVMN